VIRIRKTHSRRPAGRARYYHSATDLYRVEQCTDERALVEDCRTGVLIDVPLSYLSRLTPVTARDGGRIGGPPCELVA
jgi:hypothetical protein